MYIIDIIIRFAPSCRQRGGEHQISRFSDYFLTNKEYFEMLGIISGTNMDIDATAREVIKDLD